MKIIVDVYNALKRFLGKTQISTSERKKFISRVAAYAKKKKNKVILVFDGGNLPYPFETKEDGVVIIESGYDLSADDVIKDLLEVSARDTTVLVSSDGELVQFANVLGTPSMGSTVFFDLVTRALGEKKISVTEKKTKKVKKTKKDLETDDLDKLMIESSKNIVYKDEDIKIKSKLRSKIRSKSEKKLLKIIDKL